MNKRGAAFKEDSSAKGMPDGQPGHGQDLGCDRIEHVYKVDIRWEQEEEEEEGHGEHPRDDRACQGPTAGREEKAHGKRGHHQAEAWNRERVPEAERNPKVPSDRRATATS